MDKIIGFLLFTAHRVSLFLFFLAVGCNPTTKNNSNDNNSSTQGEKIEFIPDCTGQHQLLFNWYNTALYHKTMANQECLKCPMLVHVFSLKNCGNDTLLLNLTDSKYAYIYKGDTTPFEGKVNSDILMLLPHESSGFEILEYLNEVPSPTYLNKFKEKSIELVFSDKRVKLAEIPTSYQKQFQILENDPFSVIDSVIVVNDTTLLQGKFVVVPGKGYKVAENIKR